VEQQPQSVANFKIKRDAVRSLTETAADVANAETVLVPAMREEEKKLRQELTDCRMRAIEPVWNMANDRLKTLVDYVDRLLLAWQSLIIERLGSGSRYIGSLQVRRPPPELWSLLSYSRYSCRPDELPDRETLQAREAKEKEETARREAAERAEMDELLKSRDNRLWDGVPWTPLF